MNFNYTPLLDDYVFRDAQQFQPQAHTYADRNFMFDPTPQTTRMATGTTRPVGQVTSAAKSSIPTDSSPFRGRCCSGSTPPTVSIEAETHAADS